jgi:hypothetical protein
MTSDTRTGHTCPAAFPQIDHQSGSPGVRLQDRSDDASRRVGTWRSPGLNGRVFLPVNGRRSLLLQAKMRPVVVVVADVLDHEPLEMPFVEYDGVIEQVPAATPDEAFRDSVLPRTSEAGPLRFDAEALDGADNLLIEVRSTVEDQITRSRIIGKRLPQLLCDPCPLEEPHG